MNDHEIYTPHDYDDSLLHDVFVSHMNGSASYVSNYESPAKGPLGFLAVVGLTPLIYKGREH